MTIYSKSVLVAAVVLITCWSILQPAHAETNENDQTSLRHVPRIYHSNFLTAVVGTTIDSGNYELTLGMEYERKLGRLFSVGVLAEHAFGALDTSVYAFPITVNIGPSKLYIAPGIEDGDRGSEFLVRIGGKFSIDFGDWEVSPQMSIDFVSGNQALLLGIGIGRGF